jgi:hypothetical protein
MLQLSGADLKALKEEFVPNPSSFSSRMSPEQPKKSLSGPSPPTATPVPSRKSFADAAAPASVAPNSPTSPGAELTENPYESLENGGEYEPRPRTESEVVITRQRFMTEDYHEIAEAADMSSRVKVTYC